MFDGKVLMITGGTGSFGQEVLKRFLSTNVSEIRIFSRDEKKQEEMRLRFNHSKLKFYIGDVRDYDSIHQAMKNVHYVFHAAALKQVPSCEFYPLEAVKSNILGAENETTITLTHNLGLLFMNNGDYEQAEVMLRKSLAIRERDNGSDHLSTLKSLNVLGLILKQTGSYKEAESLYRRSLKSRQKLLGDEHPSTITSMINLGALLKNMGDSSGAESIMRTSLELCTRTLGYDHRSTLTVQNNLGLILMDKGVYEEVEPLYLRSLEGREKILGKEH